MRTLINIQHCIAALLLSWAAQGREIAPVPPATDTLAIEDVTVSASAPRSRSITESIDPALPARLGGAAANFESVIKTLAGVQSGSELSSQYMVRGGSYDENQVYVNGIEVFRPVLLRSGQQEGLSFINANMVSSIEFSTGGFGADLGDKLSSALNVRYRRPSSNGGSAEGGALGGAAAGYFASDSRKASGVVGARYRRNDYLLSTLDNEGEYNPVFCDFQALLHYDFSPKFAIHCFGAYAVNEYNFIPQSRNTSFAALNAPTFMMYNEGAERDRYDYLLGALAADYSPSANTALHFTLSATSIDEREAFDVQSVYWFSDALNDGDRSITDLMAMREHARNYLSTRIVSGAHRGTWSHGSGSLQWGTQLQYYSVSDNTEQWKALDSADYMYPHTGSVLTMRSVVNRASALNNLRWSGWLQHVFDWSAGGERFQTIAGARAVYSQLNGEWLLSPRLQTLWYPNGDKQRRLYIASGIYQQPLFYREMKDRAAMLHTSAAAQKAFHLVVGGSMLIHRKGVPVKLTAEAYYKRLWDIIPYTRDNVSISYEPTLTANGYIYGCDLKANAEFYEGVESWASISLMNARQQIAGSTAGWLPLPSDQRINASVMFQDRIPTNKRWGAYLLFHYGSPLPVFVPTDGGSLRYFRMPAYHRADLGLTYALLDRKLPPVTALGSSPALRPFQSCVITFEIMNLFDINNTSSYLFVDIFGADGIKTAAVPNYLTSRRFNVRVSIGF